MTNSEKLAKICGHHFTKGICYSGYRKNQSPRTGVYPSYAEIKEDLTIISQHWQTIRMYDPSPHARMTLEVIKQDFPTMRVLIGIDVHPEIYNTNCTWAKPITADDIQRNREHNNSSLKKIIALSKEFEPWVIGVSAGNEATVDWTENLMPVERIAEFLRTLRLEQNRPVTFCENIVPWHGKIKDLVPLVDFISIHTYPIWENIGIHQAIEATIAQYQRIADLYPEKPVIITEAGWATASNGRGIPPESANEMNQLEYIKHIQNWYLDSQIPVFLFEAFDEPWKGSADPDEPEKHWGLYTVDRSPKMAAAVLK